MDYFEPCSRGHTEKGEMNKLKALLRKMLETEHLLKVFRGRRFIFVFHDVSDPDAMHHSAHYSTAVERFAEQMTLLHRLFEIVPLSRLVSDKGLDPAKNHAAITFDDGFSSVLQNAHPILSQLNIPYTVFLNGAAIRHNQLWTSNLVLTGRDGEYVQKLLSFTGTHCHEGEDPVRVIMDRGKFGPGFAEGYKVTTTTRLYMDEKDVQTLVTRGVTLGSHGYDHLVMSACYNTVCRDQVRKNAELLEAITGNNTKHFALPFGKKEHFNDAVLDEIHAAGHQHIYTTNPNSFTARDLDNKNFLFPRIGLTNEEPGRLLFYINRSLLRKYDL